MTESILTKVVVKMNVGQVEGLLVLPLFLGYLYLWWQKRTIMLIDNGIPEKWAKAQHAKD
jgi:hypothetical protein